MAAMQGVRGRVSHADLERMPDDGRRYELYDGELSVVPAPLPRHQRALLNLEDILRTYVKAHGGEVLVSPLDIVLSDYNVVQPDLVFFGAARQHMVKADEAIRVPPDMAIEILSPSTTATDRGRKMRLLARFGLPEYWLVDPVAGSIESYALIGSGFELRQAVSGRGVARSVTFPDLEVPLTEVFPA